MARVLVVDDEPDALELLREFLLEKGYSVTTASDGPGAVRGAKLERPHAMLLDIRMPGMSGMDVLRCVRKIDPGIGVIMTTAVCDERLGQDALRLGAFDYLVKPLDLEYLERSLWYMVTPMLL